MELDSKHYLEVICDVSRQEKRVMDREVTCEAVPVILKGGSELAHNYDGMGTGGCLCAHYSFSKTWVVWGKAGFRRSGVVDQELNRYQLMLPRARFPKQNHLSFALKCWEDCERPSFERVCACLLLFFSNMRISGSPTNISVSLEFP